MRCGAAPDYGFGISVKETDGHRVVGHGGGFDGISANLDMFLDSGYTGVVMANHDHATQPVSEMIRELMAARK